MVRAQLEHEERLLDKSALLFLDCPGTCAKTQMPPLDPEGCEACPVRIGKRRLEREYQTHLRRFCGTEDGKSSGTPKSDWALDDLFISYAHAAQLHVDLDRGRIGREELDDNEWEILRIYQDEKWKHDHRRWNKPDEK
jgi:hypothetical protein